MDSDPEVIAEKKKTLLMHLRIERYKEMATAVGFFLQTFKSETVSLVTGAGTLVVGWYQLRKWAAEGRAEVQALKVEAATTHPPRPRASAPAGETMESVEVSAAPSPEIPQSPMTDPMNYVTVGLPAIFIWSSAKAWLKHRKKKEEGTT